MDSGSGISDDLIEDLDLQTHALYAKFKQTQDIRDLEAAVETTRQAVAITAHGHFHAHFLDFLGVLVFDKFRRTGVDADLQASVDFATQALDSTTKDDPERPAIINNLAVKLRERSKKTTGTADLEKGIGLCREALNLPVQRVQNRQVLLSTLGTLLGLLFRRQPDIKHLQEAIQVSEESLKLAEDGSDFKAVAHNNLANRLENLYNRIGGRDPLNEAIRHAREAVRCTANEFYRASRWSGLGRKLVYRYYQTSSLGDLDDAIACLKQGVSSPLNRNDGDWPGFANMLAQAFSLRYQRTGDEEDLGEAIRFQRQAINHQTLHRGHPDRRAFVNNLGSHLMNTYYERGRVADLEEAIQVFREAVELGEASGEGDHPVQLERRYNLGVVCHEMYLVTGSQAPALLEEASRNVQLAVSLIEDDRPTKAVFLGALGRIHKTLGDVSQALQCYIQSAENPYGPPVHRITSARAALRIYRSTGSWDKAIPLVRNASQLLPLVCSRYASLRDQEYAIANVSGLAADACSLLLMSGNSEEALQKLEFGRGLILSYLVDGRRDHSRMKEDPEVRGLIERYEHLQQQLSEADDAARGSGKRDQLLDEIERCANDIRKLHKYKRFLLEPAIEEIKGAAADCPIIIVNSTDIASHAIIVWKGKVTGLFLERLSFKAVPANIRTRLERYEYSLRGYPYRDIGRDIDIRRESGFDFLSWLWENCVKIVLDKLESLGLPLDGQHRVWWIGTGVARAFPFHAAGMHHSDLPSECTLTKVVSSYASSIKTLEFSRSQSSKATHGGGPNTLVFVGMPTTPGDSRPLPGVLSEESVVSEACGKQYEFESRRHPTVSEVLEKITQSKVVHFACHGFADPRLPSESHLLLQKREGNGLVVDRLTVDKLSKIRSEQHHSFLAFLSACSTAEVKAASEVGDQALHLASIFQVSGFAHTVGALWSASDQICVQLAKEFYTKIFEDGNGELCDDMVARALHSAVQTVRSTSKRPEIWAPFVHFGA